MSQFNSSDDETDFIAVNTANYERIQKKVAKINYADGIADGREKVFQSSFDQGYADGFRTGIELAKLQKFYDTLKAANIDENLAKENVIYQQLKLSKPTNKAHFKYLEHQSEPLSIVSEKQKAYMDSLLEHCAENLQITTNLFKAK
ncbi:hypothetical protein ACLKA6_016573 [Drosophila palustris]